MSHVTVIKVEIKNLEALQQAAEAIGLEFRKNQKNYNWYGRSVGDYPLPAGFTTEDLGKCDHALGIPNNPSAYEIGVVERDGKYLLVWDFWNGGFGLQDVVGNDCCNLTDKYAETVAVNEASEFAEANGWSVDQEYNEETSETTITLRKY
jgi:hypothetical protein